VDRQQAPEVVSEPDELVEEERWFEERTVGIAPGPADVEPWRRA
jgi:hypothetical protein